MLVSVLLKSLVRELQRPIWRHVMGTIPSGTFSFRASPGPLDAPERYPLAFLPGARWYSDPIGVAVEEEDVDRSWLGHIVSIQDSQTVSIQELTVRGPSEVTPLQWLEIGR